MAKERFRVIAEDSVVLGNATGEEFEFDFEKGGYDKAALIAGGLIEAIKPAKPEKEKEE